MLINQWEITTSNSLLHPETNPALAIALYMWTTGSAKMKRMLLVTLGISAVSALVVGNAYSQKRQFYSTVVYLLNSNRTLGVRVAYYTL